MTMMSQRLVERKHEVEREAEKLWRFRYNITHNDPLGWHNVSDQMQGRFRREVLHRDKYKKGAKQS